MSQLSEYLNPFTFLNHLEEIFFTPYSKEEKLTQSGVKHLAKAPQPGATELGFNSIPG